MPSQRVRTMRALGVMILAALSVPVAYLAGWY